MLRWRQKPLGRFGLLPPLLPFSPIFLLDGDFALFLAQSSSIPSELTFTHTTHILTIVKNILRSWEIWRSQWRIPNPQMGIRHTEVKKEDPEDNDSDTTRFSLTAEVFDKTHLLPTRETLDLSGSSLAQRRAAKRAEEFSSFFGPGCGGE